VHTPSTALPFFDNAKDGSPLVSFAETSSGMLGFIRAVVVSRRNAERAVTSQRRGSVGFVGSSLPRLMTRMIRMRAVPNVVALGASGAPQTRLKACG
jgi:hypothetical protein